MYKSATNRDVLALTVAGVVVAVLGCGLVGAWLSASRTAPRATSHEFDEFDGKRDLVPRYQLCLLKGFPRSIQLMEGANAPLLSVPPEAGSDAVHGGSDAKRQVSRYAIVDRWIVGRVDPRVGVPPKLSDPEAAQSEYFILDPREDAVTYQKTRADWCAGCKAIGIDCEAIVWVDPNPRRQPDR